MIRFKTIFAFIFLLFQVTHADSSFAAVKRDTIYTIFQFPKNQIPRIDGEFSDWNIIPDSYKIGLKELKNTRFGEGKNPDPNDFDIDVKVGWVKGLNRLYFYVDAFDDYWDFSDPVMRQDIFELVVDGDRSGGKFIEDANWDFNKREKDSKFFEGEGTKAQNYHIFLPAQNKDWAMAWGNFPWIKEFPYANSASNFNFRQGESGRLQMEFYITPFDFASFDGPKKSEESNLKENELVGISWAMLDFDGKKFEAFMNLSHDFQMISEASFLCDFRLMPIENYLTKTINADWKCNVENEEKRIIRFYDTSYVQIAKWNCDFGVWNNHGSIVEFKNQWYVFYHRSSHGSDKMRRSCVEPIFFNEDGSIAEVEMTSPGAGLPINAFEDIEAERACLIFGKAHLQLWNPNNEDLAGMDNGDRVAFKYIDFGKDEAKKVEFVVIAGKSPGKIMVNIGKSWHQNIAVIDIPAKTNNQKWITVSADVKDVSGVQEVWLTFLGTRNDLFSVDKFVFRQ